MMRRLSLWSSKKAKGFTLIELISVIMVIGIISALGGQFVISAIENYQTSAERSQLIRDGRLTMERMTRQLRNALPNSVRVNGNCLEFIPVVGGGHYLSDLPDIDNGRGAITNFETSGYVINSGQGPAQQLFISPFDGEPYSSAVIVRSLLSAPLSEGSTGTQINLSSGTVFERNSVSKRFFLTTNPQAFCLVGSNLNYEHDYGAPGSSISTTGPVLADAISATTPFSVSAGTEDRNTIVDVILTFSRGSQSVTLSEQVFIRNVP